METLKKINKYHRSFFGLSWALEVSLDFGKFQLDIFNDQALVQ